MKGKVWGQNLCGTRKGNTEIGSLGSDEICKAEVNYKITGQSLDKCPHKHRYAKLLQSLVALTKPHLVHYVTLLCPSSVFEFSALCCKPYDPVSSYSLMDIFFFHLLLKHLLLFCHLFQTCRLILCCCFCTYSPQLSSQLPQTD